MSEPFPDPAPEPEPSPEPEPEPEPAWSGPTQEEWTAQQQALSYLAQAVLPQQEGQPQVDPFADDFQARLDSYIEQKLAPLTSFQQEAAMQEAEGRAMEILGRHAETDPYLLPDSMQKARALANEFLPQAQRQYGYGPKAAEAALEQAHKAVREWETNVGKAYYERELAQLQGLSGVRREPQPAGVNGAASQVIAESGPGDERALLSKYFPSG